MDNPTHVTLLVKQFMLKNISNVHGYKFWAINKESVAHGFPKIIQKQSKKQNLFV